MRPEAWERAAAAIGAAGLDDPAVLAQVAGESDADTVRALAVVALVALRGFAQEVDTEPMDLLRVLLLELAREAEESRE